VETTIMCVVYVPHDASIQGLKMAGRLAHHLLDILLPSLMLLTLLSLQPVPERNLSMYRHMVFQATKGKLFS